jgi:hypothetical protein
MTKPKKMLKVSLSLIGGSPHLARSIV